MADMAVDAGAELPPRPRGPLARFLARLMGFLTTPGRKPDRRPPLAVFDTTADKPRDLDNPFSDPVVQRRMGTALAEKARGRQRRHW